MNKIDTTNTRPVNSLLGMTVLLSRTCKKSAPTLPRPAPSKTAARTLRPARPTGTTNKIPKEVSFNRNVGIKSFQTIKGDLQRACYSKADFEHFEDQAMADTIIVRRLLKIRDKRPLDFHEQLVLDATPTRGIEQFMSSTKRIYARMQQQSDVIIAVLAEQQRQRANNNVEPDIIALASLNHSFVARERAAELGMIDAIEADLVHRE